MREPKNCERAELKVGEIYSLAEGEVNPDWAPLLNRSRALLGRGVGHAPLRVHWLDLAPTLPGDLERVQVRQ
jgi:hypothetical protein